MTQELRILITGVPHAGKTTLAKAMARELGYRHLCTDPDFKGGDLPREHSSWGQDSAFIAATWLTAPGPWIVEGVAVGRALRKWREHRPGQPPPAERLILLGLPYDRLNPKQEAMGKGLITVLKDILPWLEPIIERRPPWATSRGKLTARPTHPSLPHFRAFPTWPRTLIPPSTTPC